MKNTNKKGFTIVELVIVIAVIAILAAVLIPTFAGLVNKANQSADVQTVRQMNTFVAMYLAENPDADILDIRKTLTDKGFNDAFEPSYEKHEFAWYPEGKCIVLLEDDKVSYPEEYVGIEFDSAKFTKLIMEVPATSEELSAAFASANSVTDGELVSIVLNKNIDNEASGAITANGGIIELDGNGNTLGANKTAINVIGTTNISIKDLVITNKTASNSDGSGASAIFINNGDSVVTIDNLTSTTKLYGLGSNASVIDNQTVMVTNSKISADIPLFISEGTWTFENCEFTGTVFIVGGNVSFKNCTFNSKDADEWNTEGNFTEEGWIEKAPTSTGGAEIVDGIAVVVLQGRNSANYASGTVNFENCTWNGGYSFATCTAVAEANRNTMTVTGAPNN